MYQIAIYTGSIGGRPRVVWELPVLPPIQVGHLISEESLPSQWRKESGRPRGTLRVEEVDWTLSVGTAALELVVSAVPLP